MRKIIFSTCVLFLFINVNYKADTLDLAGDISPGEKVTFKYTFSNPEPECESDADSCEIDTSPFNVAGRIYSTEVTKDKYNYDETIFDYSEAEIKYVDKNGSEEKPAASDMNITASGYAIANLPFGTKSYSITIPIKEENVFRSKVTWKTPSITKSYNMAASNVTIDYTDLDNLIYIDSPQTSSNKKTITDQNVINLLGMSAKDGGTDITKSIHMIDDKATKDAKENAPFVVGAYLTYEKKIHFITVDSNGISDRWDKDSSGIPPFSDLYFDAQVIMGWDCMPFETNYSVKGKINNKSVNFLDINAEGPDGCVPLDSTYNPVDGSEYDYTNYVTYNVSLVYGGETIPFDKEIRQWYPTQFSKFYDFRTGEGEILDSLDEVKTNPVYIRFEFDDRGGDEDFEGETNYYTYIESFKNVVHDIKEGKVIIDKLSYSHNSDEPLSIPGYWNDGYFNGDVSVDQTPILTPEDVLYRAINMSFESFFPKEILDDTIRLPYMTIGDKDYYKMSTMVDSNGKILDKFIIERFSGRIYNTAEVSDCNAASELYSCDDDSDIANLSEKTEDVNKIREGQNDANDVDMKLNTLTEKGFPLKSSILNSAFNYKEIIDARNLGLNGINVTYYSKMNFVSKMYGYSSRSMSKYYFERVKVTDDEVQCVSGMQPGPGPASCGLIDSVGGYLHDAAGLKRWLHSNIVQNFPSYISDNERYQEFGSDATPPVVYNVVGSNAGAQQFNYTPIYLFDVDYSEWARYYPSIDGNPATDFTAVANWLGVGAWDKEDGSSTSRIRASFLQGMDYCSPTHTFNLAFRDDSGEDSNKLHVSITMNQSSLKNCGASS